MIHEDPTSYIEFAIHNQEWFFDVFLYYKLFAFIKLTLNLILIFYLLLLLLLLLLFLFGLLIIIIHIFFKPTVVIFDQ